MAAARGARAAALLLWPWPGSCIVAFYPPAIVNFKIQRISTVLCNDELARSDAESASCQPHQAPQSMT